MGHLQEDMESREERRERARKRMLRAQAEKIRRIKIYSCIIAVGVIIVMLAAWRVSGSCNSCMGACRFCSGDDRLIDIINRDDKNTEAESVNGTASDATYNIFFMRIILLLNSMQIYDILYLIFSQKEISFY